MGFRARSRAGLAVVLVALGVVACTPTGAGAPPAAAPAWSIPPSTWAIPIGTAAVALPSPAPGVTVAIDEDAYEIRGATVIELLAAIADRELRDSTGDLVDAVWSWHIDGTWEYGGDGACRADTVTAAVDMELVLPTWSPPDEVDPAVVRGWQAYISALRVHESGHGANGVQAANEVVAAMRSLPPASSCAVFEVLADRAFDAILARARERDRAYDVETGHGRTQGVVLEALP